MGEKSGGAKPEAHGRVKLEKGVEAKVGEVPWSRGGKATIYVTPLSNWITSARLRPNGGRIYLELVHAYEAAGKTLETVYPIAVSAEKPDETRGTLAAPVRVATPYLAKLPDAKPYARLARLRIEVERGGAKRSVEYTVFNLRRRSRSWIKGPILYLTGEERTVRSVVENGEVFQYVSDLSLLV